MKGIMALIALVSCLLAGCASARLPSQRHAESSRYTQLSANSSPNSATRGYIICSQAAAKLTTACQGYRYSDFGGSLK